jgi:hypothetical protein
MRLSDRSGCSSDRTKVHGPFFLGKFSADLGGAIMAGNPLSEIIRLADVEPAFGIL